MFVCGFNGYGTIVAVTKPLRTSLFGYVYDICSPNHSYCLKRFKLSVSSMDTETLSHMCRIFYLCESALDMISLHSRVSDLIFQALIFLQESDFETVGKVIRINLFGRL